MCASKQSVTRLQAAVAVAALPALFHAEHVLSVLAVVVIAAAIAVSAAGVAYLCYVLRRDRVVNRAMAYELAAEAQRQLDGDPARTSPTGKMHRAEPAARMTREQA